MNTEHLIRILPETTRTDNPVDDFIVDVMRFFTSGQGDASELRTRESEEGT